MEIVMKRILPILLVIIMLLSFASCDSSEKKNEVSSKEISAYGMKITLTSQFMVASKNEADKYGLTQIINSKAISILCVKEDKANLNNVGVKTLSQYANAIRNACISHDPGIVKQEDGLEYTFEYVARNPDDNRDYTYFTVLYEAESAFWCIQFVCSTPKYEELKPSMIQYARSVTFVD